MKRLAILSILVWCTTLGRAQLNLIPNSNFEDTLHCSGDSSKRIPEFWYSPTSGTPDYYYFNNSWFSGCPFSYYGSWNGFSYSTAIGNQLPHTGSGYIGCRSSDEYFAIQLIDSLIPGRKYCVSAYVSLADESRLGLDLIQFCFSKNEITNYDTINGNYLHLDSAQADAGNHSGNFLIDTTGWMLISDTFIAHGGERYMTVGNFDTAQTQYYLVDSSHFSYTYYYFDDISLYYCDTDAAVPEHFSSSFSLYPNPSGGNFQLKGNFPEHAFLRLYDLSGRLVCDPVPVPPGNQDFPVTIDVSDGVYFCRIVANSEVLHEKKIVILH